MRDRMSETIDTNTQLVTTTALGPIEKTAHDAVLETYSEEAQRSYPDGWNDEERADFQEWVKRTITDMASDNQLPRPQTPLSWSYWLGR